MIFTNPDLWFIQSKKLMLKDRNLFPFFLHSLNPKRKNLVYIVAFPAVGFLRRVVGQAGFFRRILRRIFGEKGFLWRNFSGKGFGRRSWWNGRLARYAVWGCRSHGRIVFLSRPFLPEAFPLLGAPYHSGRGIPRPSCRPSAAVKHMSAKKKGGLKGKYTESPPSQITAAEVILLGKRILTHPLCFQWMRDRSPPRAIR